MIIRSFLLGVLPALVVAAFAASPLYATDAGAPVVTVVAVRKMQARLPNCEIGCTVTGGYANAGDALEIAQAIARVARTELEAAELSTYAAFESANQKSIVSADGRDWGAWQLRDAGQPALDPVKAARLWLAAADASRALCASNPAAEQLAALASGSCDHGREKVRHRNDIARSIIR